MLDFIITIAVVAICLLIFGKADTKKRILNQIGLDLSESKYNNKKEKEFSKYCKKAIKISSKNYIAKDELDFINHSYHYLADRCFNNLYVGVKSHYAEFAMTILSRREKAIASGDTCRNLQNLNFAKRGSVKKYIKQLWDNYQYPWPKNWLQNDSDI
ncbi:MAG: hypothetical protein NC402_02735 [Prevotella sp.]|nr:hypothetical protein [Prevotella sp.]MCM1074815.1 hypothetical protein [Ruminococcus sp.]